MSSQSPVQIVERQGVEICIYRVLKGYRVEVSGIGTQFYWHPGIFPELPALWDWLVPQLEAFVEDGVALGGEWMMLEGDFDGNGFYRDWFVCKTAQSWQGYDPVTNCCYTAPTWQALREKIEKVKKSRLFSYHSSVTK